MIPKREVATRNGQTYFVTWNTAERRPFFRHERWAKLFLEVLYGYRPERYLLHGFVLMPDHFHLLLTPTASLELAVQCLKGGFSFRAKRELGWKAAVEQAGQYAYSSANGQFELDPLPRGLKPLPLANAYGAAKAAPFQNKSDDSAVEAMHFQCKDNCKSSLK
jgi:putative transposase